jgi:serine/threonine-protein kinase
VLATEQTGPNGMRYEPIAQIGRGGMAEVLLAVVHAGAGARRLAAVKRVWPELATDPAFQQMFLDEARLALRLNHPNIVQTYEIMAGDGELAIAMEYLDGQPLTQIWNRFLRRRTARTFQLRLRIVMSVLAGLEYLHALTDLDGTPLGVVHRDVSPQNVFVTYDGHVKLVDFGVAKTLAASQHTRPGALKGKIAYMAPEQLRGVAIDRRVDVFAAGVMLWEMVAGQRIWQGMSEAEVVGHLASARPMPPLPADRDLPPNLDAICARALAPDPDHRYPSASHFRIELEQTLLGSADADARKLGKAVSLAFEAERATRQSLIERSVRATSAERQPPVTDQRASGSTRPSQSEIKTVLEPVGPDAARRSLLWFRRAATVTALVGGVAVSLVAAAWRMPATASTPRPLAPVPAQPSLPVSCPAPPSATGSQAPSLPNVPAPAAAGPAAAPRVVAIPAPTPENTQERASHRRHHHRPVMDEDATLPPTDDDDGR